MEIPMLVVHQLYYYNDKLQWNIGKDTKHIKNLMLYYDNESQYNIIKGNALSF